MDKFIKRFGRVITFLLAMVLVFNVSGNVNAAKKKKTVVIYFSATGTTKSVAGKIKKATNGTLIGIKASQPYTDDDLNWSNSNSRVTKEHESASSPAKSKVRPEISNLKQIQKAVKSADIVYIGFPIWWGEAPHIVYTLVESTSLKGKTVVPFSTSLSSGMGNSGSNLKTKAIISKTTKWNKGKGFYGKSSQKTVDKWVKTIK